MVRTPSFDKNGIKKGAWSSEEDEILRAYILKRGHGNWRELPRLAGLKRCGKSCRLRWMNYLRPDLKHGSYTKAEEDLILRLHEQHGNKWAMIASKLDGRSDNEIKNHWHTHLKKRVTRPQKPTNNNNNNKNQKPSIDDQIAVSDPSRKSNSMLLCGDNIQILESCPLISPEEVGPSSTSTCELSSLISSPFEISTSSLDDDGGLEEMLNSSDLFAEMSSLIRSPYEFETSIAIDNVYRELLEEEWNPTYPSYLDESFFTELSSVFDIFRADDDALN